MIKINKLIKAKYLKRIKHKSPRIKAFNLKIKKRSQNNSLSNNNNKSNNKRKIFLRVNKISKHNKTPLTNSNKSNNQKNNSLNNHRNSLHSNNNRRKSLLLRMTQQSKIKTVLKKIKTSKIKDLLIMSKSKRKNIEKN